MPDYFGNTQSYGGIGLAPFSGDTDSDTDSNTQPPPLAYVQPLIFSFLINSTSDEGELILGFDSTYATNSQSAQSLAAYDGLWMTTYTNYTFGTLSVDLDLSKMMPILTFDVIYQRIAFDPTEYQQIMLSLLEFKDQGMQCSYNDTATDFSDCYFTGDIWALPNLVYITQDTNLTIPPTVYMENLGNCTYKTMFDSYNLGFYHNNMPAGTVFGAKVMSKFYSVFNASFQGQEQTRLYPNITLYPIDSNLFANTSNTSTCSLPNNSNANNGNNGNTNNNTNTTTGNNNNSTRGSSNPPDTSGTDPASRGGNNSTLIIIIAVIGVCVLLGGGFLLYRFISKRNIRNRPGAADGDLSSRLGSNQSDMEIKPYSG